ncbi:MAG: MCE family protein [Nitrospirae bacterium]|nr:MCE family protein [Nitrospirota bacterium]
MRGLSTELKVGIFAVTVIAILAFMTFKIGGLDWIKKEGHAVYVYFNNIAGLNEKTKVKVAGVDAGVIEKIELKDGKAKLTVKMDKDVKLYSDASATIKAAGLLGDKYLEIKTGSKEPALEHGAIVRNVIEIVDLDDLTRNLTAVSENINILAETLNETLGTSEAKNALRDSILNLKDITISLKETIDVNDKKMRTTLDNISNLASSINELIEENKETVSTAASNIKDFSDSLKTEGPQLVANLNKAAMELKTMVEENRPSIKKTTDSLDQIAGKIEKGEGTLGKLIKDERLYESVSRAAEGLERTVSSIERFRTFVNFQIEYLTKLDDAKGYFYVTLQPKPDKYYILGVVGDPIGRVTTTETIRTTETETTRVVKEDIRKRIEFTAQFAMRHQDAALRIGITENTFGVGSDYFFHDDKGRITADIWDFSGDEAGAKNPHLKIGVDYFIFKNLFLSAGADNILNRKWRGGYAGIGLRFEDEDLKYLFGTLPSISAR